MCRVGLVPGSGKSRVSNMLHLSCRTHHTVSIDVPKMLSQLLDLCGTQLPQERAELCTQFAAVGTEVKS